MDEDLIRVQTFDLGDMHQKAAYEDLRNKYEMIKEEFAYMRDGTPKVTLWYAVPKSS
jgi:3-deoxy-D-manno-octulosonate 8-phosphate phosphatase KdsC-like HAD superfamily phosphatase